MVTNLFRTPIVLAVLLGGVAHAQSVVFVENATERELEVVDVRVGGDPISAKAWRRMADVIAPGERVGVLSIERSGKVNWMDPTPRFIEPGKTAVFTTVLAPTGEGSSASVELLQRLEGTGRASRMWYSVAGAAEPYRPETDTRPLDGVSGPNETSGVAYRYRAYADGADVHVEYVLGTPPE